MVGGWGFGRIVGVGGAHGCSFSIVVFNSHWWKSLGGLDVGTGWGSGLLESSVHKIDKWLRIVRGGRVA